MKLTVNEAKAVPHFVYYFFRHPQTVQSIKNRAITSGVPHINLGILREFEMPLPPLGAQQVIVSILSAYDKLIENNRRRMALLEESARLLYQEWFVRLRFPGHEHARITNGVPKGWRGKTLGDLCAEVREHVSPGKIEPETPYVGLKHMPRRSISPTEWGRADAVTSTKHLFKTGDILFGKIRPYFHKVGLAFTDGVSSSDAIVIRPAEESLRSFVLTTVSTDHFVAFASKTARKGSKMPRAEWKLMTQFKVALPPPGLLESFSSSITAITDQLRTLCFQNQRLRAARDLLLPRLMSGGVAV